MSKTKPSITNILLVWLTALVVAFTLPEASTSQRYLLGLGASILALGYLGYSRWDMISKDPKKKIQAGLFVFQTIFFFYVAYIFWSFAVALWQTPPTINGIYVVSWGAVFLVAIAVIGLWSFYLGIQSIRNTYAWIRENKKKKKRQKGQSAL